MREVELSLNGTLREIFSLGKAVPRLIGFCPVCVSWQNRSVTAPLGIDLVMSFLKSF
ncbi:hypothetical protein NIA69_07500 [Gemmiger formicilis]|nr:hypothetical protein [Gemmiger formicilis]